MRRLLALLGVLVVIMAVPLLQPSRFFIQVTTADGVVASCTRVSLNDDMTLQFTHSMFGGYVRETWRVTPNQHLSRVRFVTENPAAAEYYATEVTAFQTEDGWEVPGDTLQQSQLVVRVNQRGRHSLTINGTTVPLADLLPGSTQVSISVTRQCQPEEST